MRFNQLRVSLAILILASLFHFIFRPISTETHFFDYLLLLIIIGVEIYAGYLIGKQDKVILVKSFIYGIFIWMVSFIFGFGELIFDYWINDNGKSQSLINIFHGLLISSLMFAPLAGTVSMFSAFITKKIFYAQK